MHQHVIVAEDQTELRQVVCLFLDQLFDVTIHQAEDGQVALNLIKTNQHIDLVITDLNMPNMNGLELTRSIRSLKNHQDTPIIMLTSEDIENREIALQLGVNDYFSKPMIPEDIMPAVKKYLG